MKLGIKQAILMENLNYVIKGISNKNLIPILNCIKFELTSEGLYLMSTDNEIAIKTFIDKKDIDNIDTCGDVVVSGRYIYDIIKKLPNDIVTIEEVMDSKVFINTTNYSFTLNCNDVSEFPILDLEDNKKPVLISKKVYRNIIYQTVFATSMEESRPVLTGLNLKIDKNVMECIATDSYRLSKKIVNLDQEVDESVNIIIPTRSLNELMKIIGDDNESMELHIFGNKIIFKFDNIIMMSRLINGSYPDISKIIPLEFKIEMQVNLNDFYKGIDSVSLLTSESDKYAIKLESSGNNVVLSSNMSEIGNAKCEVAVQKKSIDDIKVAFSSKFMMDALKSLECENILLMFNADDKPIIIKNVESDDLIQLIVPYRTY